MKLLDVKFFKGDGRREGKLTSSQHGCSTKAQSSVTASFEYKCRTGTARIFGGQLYVYIYIPPYSCHNKHRHFRTSISKFMVIVDCR